MSHDISPYVGEILTHHPRIIVRDKLGVVRLSIFWFWVTEIIFDFFVG